MGVIIAALLLPYRVKFDEEKRKISESNPPNGDKALLLPLPAQLQQQPHASQALQDPDVPFEFASSKKTQQKAPQVQKHIVDQRKDINPKPQVATVPLDTIRRRRGISVSHKVKPTEFQIKRQHGGNGSLYNAINRAKANGIIKDLKWVGLCGSSTDHVYEKERLKICQEYEKYDCHPVFVGDKAYVGHYDHFCKDILFPTFHCQVPEIPRSKAYLDQSWDDYVAVNRMIADQCISSYEPGDYIWIQDYHLMLVPQMIREALPQAAISFFMHISFPTSEVFRCLANRSDILQGMLSSNCIGFQNDEYAQHFMMTSSRILAYDASQHCVQTPDRDVHIFACPIGIDPERLHDLKSSEKVLSQRERIRSRWPDTKIIGARDKLDPTRGIVPKLRAYGALLDQYPELARKTVLIQICLPSVACEPELEVEIATISDGINSKYGDISGDIHPVVILRQDVLFEQYLALICEADVFAVTALRDGMNLTCHEFVYCNDRDGPLILSEFTGSATVLEEGSLIVNPWDKNGMKDAFYKALNMPADERKRDWKLLEDVILSHTCIDWVTQCFEQIEKAWEDDKARTANKPDMAKIKQLYDNVTDGYRLFTIEVPTGNALFGEDAYRKPTTARRVSLNSSSQQYFNTRLTLTLQKLADDPKNLVYIGSAESRRFMERSFRQLPTIGLIAESGRYLRIHNTDKWLEIGLDMNLDWKEEITPILKRMEERLPVRELNIHENTIVVDFDYSEQIDRDRTLATIGEYTSLIDDAFSEKGLRCRFEHNQLLIYTLDVISLRTKLFKTLLAHLPTPISLLFVGSQPLATHEDDVLYSDLLDLCATNKCDKLITVVMANSPSLAKYRVSGVNSLMTLLASLASSGTVAK